MIEVCIFFDIETLPTDDETLIADIASSIAPPSRMSKAETIAAWEANERPAAIVEAVAKTALDGGLGRVASIAYAHGDGEIDCELALDENGQPGIEAERWLLSGFFAECVRIQKSFGVPPCLVGHNIQFDLRFLWKRAIVLGIRPPYWWPHDARPWDEDRVVDTMALWEGPRGWISQDRLARILGLPGKSGFDGSQVAGAWERGEYQRIREYNVDDVQTLRGIWRRITGHVPSTSTVTLERAA